MILPNENGGPDAPEPHKKQPQEPEAHGPDELMDWIGGDLGEADAGWREELLEDLREAMQDLGGFPDPEAEFDPPEPPDLYSFYYEMLGMRNALRKAHQDSASELRRQREAVKRLADAVGAQPTQNLSEFQQLADELQNSGQMDFAQRLRALLTKAKKKP